MHRVAGWRSGRHVRGDDLEHLADEPVVLGPGRETDLAAGAADTRVSSAAAWWWFGANIAP